MKRKLILICSLVGSAMSVPVAAQDTGHIVQRYDRAEIEEGKTDDTAAPLGILNDYASCLVGAARRPVERYLLTIPFSQDALKGARNLVTDECLQEGEMRFQPEALRGPLYQALYRKDFAKRPVSDLNAAPTLDYGSIEQSPNQVDKLQIALRHFGDCVVRRDEKRSREIILSDIGSDVEKQAFQMLVPAMGGCLIQGTTLNLKRPMLRALIAENLYRLSVARAGMAAGGRQDGQ